MPPRSSSSGSTPFPFLEAKSAAAADELESSLPLGQRLVRAGMLSQSQLAQALREQQQNHLKLGEVCLERGWLQLSDLYRFIPSQALSLGEILVALGYLDFEQLRVALAQQRRYGRKLGEILTWKGWVQQSTLDHALDAQVQLQRLASPNAWEALQSFLAAAPEPALPSTPVEPEPVESVDPLQIIQIQARTPAPTPYREELTEGLQSQDSGIPAELKTAEELPPVPKPGAEPVAALLAPQVLDPNSPFAPESQPTTIADYRRQVEALKLQIHLQEREWDGILANMNQQVADFQSQYQQRIQKLEATIRLQQAEIQQQATLQQDLMVWREQLQRLETDLANARAAEQKAQRQLQTQQDCYQSELEQLQEQIQILQRRQMDSVPTSVVADLQAQLESALQQIQQLQSERDRLEAKLFLQGIPQAVTSDPAEPVEDQVSGVESLELVRLQAQVASLQEQLLESSAALRSWEERYARLQQEHDIQRAQLSGRPHPKHVEALQAQLGQFQAEMTRLITVNREYEAQITQQEEQLQQSQAQIAQMTAEREEMDQRMAELEGALQTRQEALQQAQQQMKSFRSRLSALQEQQANLTVELQHARELLAAYRQSLESLQENLKIQQDQNRLLQVSYEQQKLIAEAARAELEAASTLVGSTRGRVSARTGGFEGPQARNQGRNEVDDGELLPNPDEDTLPDPLLAELTPWARHLFQNLQEAGLLDQLQIEHVLTTWQQSGGKLTAVIGECTGLKATTIKFFADGGYSARLAGCRRVEEFLKAADLLDNTVLESLPSMDESDHWGDPLIEQGLLRLETIQYFRKHFLQPSANE
ncbi:hypothetical protein L1047_16485 [Synechococcus sp. Nb3U1]|uniref:hypothetical protein n=1 Tax=Synechococcus sp. Nb3U1 TaxID=1914529 RepID=UPI001F1B2E02|nr:hypothetical protein [Synechococcus sp. Nb3U1]MCF2972791.1 hypothetical protein [Synechococcus sp. Nb3U1]